MWYSDSCFLKYVSDKFYERREELTQELMDEGIDDDQIPSFLEDRDEYSGKNVFWIPDGARWEQLQAKAKLPGIGQAIDEAMRLIERENPTLMGVLPRNYGREDLKDEMLVSSLTSSAPSVSARILIMGLTTFSAASTNTSLACLPGQRG